VAHISSAGACFSLLQQFASIPQLLDLFKTENWKVLTSPNSPAYHPFWAPLILSEVTTNVALIILEILILYFFRRKRPLLPRLMIVWLISLLAVSFADSVLSLQIPAIASQATDFQEIVRPLVGCAVWIPYFLTSRRVKATFVQQA